METIVRRTHYGLEAETRYGQTIFRTMRTYSGAITTSVWSIIDNFTPGILGTTPTGERRAWPEKVKMLTEKKLREIHEQNINLLLPTLRKPVDTPQSIFNL